MVKGKGTSKLIVTIVVLVLTLLVVGGIAIWRAQHQTPTVETENQIETSNDESTTTEPAAAEPETTVTTPVATSQVDPSTLKSIDIEPLNIAVFYSEGASGFEYNVMRTSDGTQYVEFSAPELVGTKCTDDTGTFASIIKDVSSTEDTSTISQKVTVDGVTYGLSLADPQCTGNATLLEQYQTAFTNGFSQLKTI